MARLVLGLDCSTQSISAVVLDAATRAVVHESALRFDEQLPGYATTNGVRRDTRDRNVVLVPSLMLVDALDRIFTELAVHAATFKLEDVVAISGSAQQHTSAFWRRGFSLRQCMEDASTEKPLVDALRDAGAFSLECGPSWMDSSTTKYCDELETSLGGADQVAKISGSRAYPRFTGNQIAKQIHDDPDFLDRTGRVSLASSLLTSLLVGDYAPIDASDGSGMNLLDLRTHKWSPELVSATVKHAKRADGEAEGVLLDMLGRDVVAPHETLGAIHRFFQRKFGFSPDCQVVPFSGDNPCTLAGIGLSQVGDIAVSLGTSSTLMAVVEPLDMVRAKDEGHFFLNPVDPKALMAMICFKNGALAREDIRDECAASNWSDFEALLRETAPGNGGTVGFFLRDPEITPLTIQAGVVFFNSTDAVVEDASQLSSAAKVRAITESQCLSLRLHAERLGIHNAKRLIATGGGAASGGFLQVLADVFGVPVLRLRDSGNSAALGGAFRAHHGLLCRDAGFASFNVDDALHFDEAARPIVAHVAIYDTALDRFAKLEGEMVQILS